MCYQALRLAFNHYTQLRGMSCISIPLQPSTAVSHGFSLATHRSTPFASYPSDFTRFHTSSLANAADWLVSLRLRYNLSLTTRINSLASVSRLTRWCWSLSIPDNRSPGVGSWSVIPSTPSHGLDNWFQALFNAFYRCFSPFTHVTSALSV